MSHWTDIPTEVMATSTICNQNSVRMCSLAVDMNNTDESFFFTVDVLKLLTFSLHKMFFLFSGHEPIYFIENKEKTLRASYDRGTQIFDYMD